MTYTMDEIMDAHRVIQLDAARRTPKRRAPADDAPADDTRPTIQITPELAPMVDGLGELLAEGADVYQRAGELVRVVRALEPDPKAGVAEGTPTIRTLPLATMREIAASIVRWEKFDKRSEEWIAAWPPEPVLSALLARGAWPGVRALAGVMEAPFLRPDGSVCARAGYDHATGNLLAIDHAIDVPDRPTVDDARGALELLAEPFVDFPFATAEARAVPIAAVLTLLARPAIVGSVPLCAIDASTRGSGKSLLADVVATIGTGRGAPRMTFAADEAEQEKGLASAAILGARLLCLDNLAGPLAGAPLDKVITATDRIAFRVLGRSEIVELPWRALLLATGNNIVLGADTARRTLLARLEPDTERPEERTGFQHRDLLAWVRDRRAELVRAALVLLRAYVVAGRPGADSYVWGSFERWAELVPAAIVWAGGPNVLACRAVDLGAPDPDAEALRVVLGDLGRIVPDGARARDIVSLLWPPDRRHGEAAPDGYDTLRDALGVLCRLRREGDAPRADVLGNALRACRGRIVGGHRLRSTQDRKGVTVWAVEAVGR